MHFHAVYMVCPCLNAVQFPRLSCPCAFATGNSVLVQTSHFFHRAGSSQTDVVQTRGQGEAALCCAVTSGPAN